MTRWIVMALGCSSAPSDNQIAINFHLIKKSVPSPLSSRTERQWRRPDELEKRKKWYTTKNKRRKKLWLRWNVKKNSFAPRIEIFCIIFCISLQWMSRERRALSRPSQFLFWNMILLRYAIANWKNNNNNRPELVQKVKYDERWDRNNFVTWFTLLTVTNKMLVAFFFSFSTFLILSANCSPLIDVWCVCVTSKKKRRVNRAKKK